MVGGYKLIDGGGLNLSTTTKQTSTLYTKLLEVVEQDKFILLENLIIGTAQVKPIPVTGWKSNTAEITLAGGGYTFVCDSSGVTISSSGGGGGGGGDFTPHELDLTGVDVSNFEVEDPIVISGLTAKCVAAVEADTLVIASGVVYDTTPYTPVPVTIRDLTAGGVGGYEIYMVGYTINVNLNDGYKIYEN